MSRQINQPSNQIKLTNVSLVRLKKGKKRFEIACYKNKVLEWRSGIETDLDNVLQIPQVFLNVSKGQTAPKEDVEKAFGKGKSTDDVVLEILKKGELQVGEKERAAQTERVQNEVVGIVASRLVDPRTKRVYTRGMIEKALDMLSSGAHEAQKDKGHKGGDAGSGGGSGVATPTSTSTSAAAAAAAAGEDGDGEDDAAKPRQKEHVPVWTGVSTTKSAKSQALEAMKALIAAQPIPVQRARMRLRVGCATSVLKQSVKAPAAGGGGAGPGAGAGGAKDGKGKKGSGGDGGDEGSKAGGAAGTVKDRILDFVEQVESQDVVGSEWEVVGFVEPGAFKGLSDFIGNETRGQGRVEVLDMAVVHED